MDFFGWCFHGSFPGLIDLNLYGLIDLDPEVFLAICLQGGSWYPSTFRV